MVVWGNRKFSLVHASFCFIIRIRRSAERELAVAREPARGRNRDCKRGPSPSTRLRMTSPVPLPSASPPAAASPPANASVRARILRPSRWPSRDVAAEDDAHRGKRPGKNEAIPASDSPRARIFHINRHDFRARLLGEKNDALPEFIGRAARSVGRDDDVPAVRDDLSELSNGAGAFARTGTPDDFEIEALHQIGEQRAVAAGADEGRAVPLRAGSV